MHVVVAADSTMLSMTGRACTRDALGFALNHTTDLQHSARIKVHNSVLVSGDSSLSAPETEHSYAKPRLELARTTRRPQPL
jgi:hypothetical protein